MLGAAPGRGRETGGVGTIWMACLMNSGKSPYKVEDPGGRCRDRLISQPLKTSLVSSLAY